MKAQLNFHSRTGLRPGFGLSLHRYGKAGFTVMLRLYWSAATFTLARGQA